jgi:hypothetical protein
MRQAWFWLVLMLVIALPTQADAQHRHGESRGLNGAVEKLIEHRVDLGMTEAQLARVQEIKDTADVRKQPLWQRIMSVRRDLKARSKAEPDMPAAEKDSLLRRSGEEIERLLDEIRAIDHAAMRQVGDVLTDPQKEEIREMISKSRRGRDRSDRNREREGSRD